MEAFALIMAVRESGTLWAAVAAFGAVLSAVASTGTIVIVCRTRRDSRRLHASRASRNARELLGDLRECQTRAHGDIIKKLKSPEVILACDELYEAAYAAGGEIERRGVAAVRAIDEWRSIVYRQPYEAGKLIGRAVDELERLVAAEAKR